MKGWIANPRKGEAVNEGIHFDQLRSRTPLDLTPENQNINPIRPGKLQSINLIAFFIYEVS